MESTKRDIRALVRLFEQSDWDEMRIETGQLKLAISKNSNAPGLTVSENPPTIRAPASAPSPKASEGVDPTARDDPTTGVPEGMMAITAPNLGTFWRAPKPGAAPYVDIGQTIDADTTVCLIEVMKLFTPVKSGIAGTVIEVVAEDGAMVEFGARLLIVDPAT